ncbi:hypothetical protein [Salinigranum halophilum]|jgi:cytochrome c biogenesis protein ResB|uniref:hypothetical protein n=1 Tax=Salinigranum halophilum TaxID=2565931 RepID=UPI00115C8249|nr:hypothetical protein [Salinigranum halophilum]
MVRPLSLAAGVAALLLVAPLVAGVAALVQFALGGFDYTSVWLVVALGVTILMLGLVVRRDARRDDDQSASVWSLIPSWQYEGRHVESGGLTRNEQEEALADVEEQAEARERGPR